MTTMRGRDDREMSADANGDRLAYLVLSFGVLAIVAYRSLLAPAAPIGQPVPAGGRRRQSGAQFTTCHWPSGVRHAVP